MEDLNSYRVMVRTVVVRVIVDRVVMVKPLLFVMGHMHQSHNFQIR